MVPTLFGVIALLALIHGQLLRSDRGPAGQWSAPLAWCRALGYFCACLLAGHYSGALAALLADPVVDPEQLSDPLWWLSSIALLIFIIVAYWGYWYQSTLRFGRPIAVVPQLVFGLGWGFTSGLLFLSFWHLALQLGDGWPRWSVCLLAYVLISVWQALWMDMVWDVYVSPEHDTPESIRRKVPRTHVPNMTFCLVWFAVYENYWLFVGLQTIALLAASFGMRMPGPWSKQPTPAPRRVPGILGIPRAGGYINE